MSNPSGDPALDESVSEVAAQPAQTSGGRNVPERFRDPHKMGFMRFIMLTQAVNIVLTATSLIFVSKNTVSFTFSDYWMLLNMLFAAVGFWLLWKRKAAARPAIIIFSALNIIESVGLSLATRGLSLDNIDLTIFWNAAMIVYMATSRRARGVLTQPFRDRSDVEQQEEASYYRPSKWSFWRNLIIYFCVFSVVGHWMEAGYCLLIKYGILPGIYDPTSQIWSDWLYPFPVYGFGAVACVLLLYPIKLFLQKHISVPVVPLVLSFIINGSVCCLIELIMGLMTNMDYSLWDYRDMFGNFMGQICLQNGLAFGAVATLMTWVIYPALEFIIRKVQRSTMTLIFIVVVVIFLILWAFYLIDMPLPDVSAIIESFGLTPIDQVPDGDVVIGVEMRDWGN